MSDEGSASNSVGADMDEVLAEGLLSGEDALVACAGLLWEKLQADSSLDKFFKDVEAAQLATQLRQFLTTLFDGEDWPEVNLSAAVIDECYEDFASVLHDALQQSEDNMIAALEALTDSMVGDERLQRFFDRIRAAAIAEEGAEEGEGDLEAADDTKIAEKTGTSTGKEINVSTLDELVLDEQYVHAGLEAWRMFINTASSREEAGEAIYAALFESAPSLQSLFTTPRAIQAMRFMGGLASFIEALGEPSKLKMLVETLGFGHLHLDVTPPRVVIFRDAIMDLFTVELGERFTTAASECWNRLLNYVGGAIIFVKSNYAGRVTTLLKSWKQCNHNDSKEIDNEVSDSADLGAIQEAKGKGQAEVKQNKKSLFGRGKAKAGTATGTAAEGDAHNNQTKLGGNAGGANNSAQSVPTTYPEMFLFNSAVMGFGKQTWMNEVLACFDNIVTNVSNSARLQEECDILALRIAKATKAQVNLAEYKSCMLASLRSLLPKDWDSAHEVAWTWLWENVERLVLRIHGKPPVWEKALGGLLGSFDEDTKYTIRKDIYNTAFATAPAIQDYFKQSNTYLHIIADKILAMTLEIFQDPVKMVDDLSALGLRHVGYGIPTELFGPFVTATIEVMQTRTSDEHTIEAFRWSLGLVAKTLVRTINEGSTIVMKAVTSNSVRQMKKAIQCAPRGERADWMLIVQVGTQSISPFAWSVESGNLDAALAIIRDLLTFRADRERYYYGVDELFKRHANAIKILCDQAPDLIPHLLDGLVWRARVTENGMRRVNYYVKHLLVDEAGNFSPALAWIADTRDAKLVCHPVIVLVSDIVWRKVAYATFLYSQSWLMFSLMVFVLSQSVLEHAHTGPKNPTEQAAIFLCRMVIYGLSMSQLVFRHTRDSVAAYKAMKTTKLLWSISIPNYMLEWQERASVLLTLCLIGMLCSEPIFWCWDYQQTTLATKEIFLAECEEREGMMESYKVFTMFVMFLYYILLLDLAVISTRISAFVLVCIRMMNEVALFLGALAACILTFSSMISVLKQDMSDFAGIHRGAYALFRMVLGAFAPTRYAKLRDEPVVLAVVFIFGISTIIFLLNMLIAQLSCAYSSVYEDMVGYARLDRAVTIVEILPSASKARWQTFVSSLRLQKRLEFNAGDIGVAGGIQAKEAASINPTTIDMIKRFGGSTSPDVQWPADEEDGEGDDRFERIEKLVQRTLQRIAKSHGRNKKGGAGTGTGTGTGTGMGSSSGTGTKQSSNSDDHSDDHAE